MNVPHQKKSTSAQARTQNSECTPLPLTVETDEQAINMLLMQLSVNIASQYGTHAYSYRQYPCTDHHFGTNIMSQTPI